MPKLKKNTITPSEQEDAAIDRGIALDPDTYVLSRDDIRHLRRVGRPLSVSPTVSLTVRYDADIIDAFKAGGSGWQTRMNNALREWLASHSA
jgi:uncharacterized protein (DUF4415 family)